MMYYGAALTGEEKAPTTKCYDYTSTTVRIYAVQIFVKHGVPEAESMV